MNRTGLAVALAVAALVGVVFGVYPQLDLDVSALFFDPATRTFKMGGQAWTLYSRDVASALVTLLVAPAFVAIVGKLTLPRRRMLIGGRAALLLIVTLALGPGVLANKIFKEHWGRMRPVDVTQFGGTDRFTPWWDPRGPCTENCSFIAGEPSGAFWTLAPAALAPPQWRLLTYGAALAFGAFVGGLRIAAGGHFFTDVVFAGVFMFLLAWVVHGLIYRWQPTRLTDKAIEQPLEWAGGAVRDALAALVRRIAARKSPRA
ncbi:MAG: phosphatase PAP2 family protein [Xanthobacteraceae bacterium]